MTKALSLLSLLAIASGANAATILVDFGATPTTGTTPTWNNFTVAALDTALALVDTTNTASGLTLTLDDAFSPLNETPAPSGLYPTTVTTDAFFGDGNRTMTLSGLNSSLTYNLTFFAYIDRPTSRLTNINVNGTIVSLEPGNGTTTGDSVTISNLAPNAQGEFEILYSKGPAVGNFIISALEITSVPEPSSAMLLGTLALAPLLRRRRA